MIPSIRERYIVLIMAQGNLPPVGIPFRIARAIGSVVTPIPESGLQGDSCVVNFLLPNHLLIKPIELTERIREANALSWSLQDHEKGNS